MFENVTNEALEAVAVDKKELATNIADVAADCEGGQTIASEIQNRFPVVNRIMSTAMSREMRRRAQENLINAHKETIDGATKYVLEIPATVYTTEPTSTANECCWVPFDFDKCASKVPLNLLCLKDCESIEDSIMDGILRFGSRDAVPGIASAGDRLADVKLRVDRLSMAFFTAKNILLGIDNTYTATLKPFHGVLSVLENPAVPHIDGTNILEAFDLLACRLAIVGGRQWFAVHPLIYSAIDAAVYPDERGNLPAHWARRNGRLEFMGRPFVEDKAMPIDTTAGTGEIWMLDDDTSGVFMATDLAPTEAFIRRSNAANNAPVEGSCGTDCLYMYNMGAAFAQDANKLAVITDVPVQAGCVDAIADLAALVAPTTLIPR